MSSSLNDLLFMKALKILRKPKFSGDELLSTAPWNHVLLDQMTDALMEAGTSEQNLNDLYRWGRFLFASQYDLNLETAPSRLADASYAIESALALLGRPTRIPVHYWVDIAPQLIDEIRKFRAQPLQLNEYRKVGFRLGVLNAKIESLAANPETREMIARWESENEFSLPR